MFKRMTSIVCVLLLVLTMCPLSFAAGGPSKADLVEIGSGIEYPRTKEYLDNYYYGTINAPKGHSVYCYGSADMNGSRYTVNHGEEVEILAKRGEMVCVIILSTNKARWVKEAYIQLDENSSLSGSSSQSTPEVTGRISPSVLDLKGIRSQIEYPKTSEYWSDYGYGTVIGRHGDQVACYGSADRLGSKYTVEVGTEVTVLANRGEMLCVIIPSISRARWINSANVELSE